MKKRVMTTLIAGSREELALAGGGADTTVNGSFSNPKGNSYADLLSSKYSISKPLEYLKPIAVKQDAPLYLCAGGFVTRLSPQEAMREGISVDHLEEARRQAVRKLRAKYVQEDEQKEKEEEDEACCIDLESGVVLLPNDPQQGKVVVCSETEDTQRMKRSRY
jgi:hypothetical protein